MDSLLNLFKSITGDKDTSNQVPLLVVIISAILPMGQIFARIFWLDGSLDKMWALFPLLWFFPFSIIPSLLMYFGYIKKGPGGKPYTEFVMIPIISKFILSFLISMIFGCGDGDGISSIFITLAIHLVLGMIPNLIRAAKVCEAELQNNKCKELTFKSVGKALVDSTIANGVGEVLPILAGFLPYVGKPLSLMYEVPGIGTIIQNIIWCMGFFITYVFINIINVNFMDKYCNPDYLGRDIFDKIGFIIMLCITFITKIYNSMM